MAQRNVIEVKFRAWGFAGSTEAPVVAPATSAAAAAAAYQEALLAALRELGAGQVRIESAYVSLGNPTSTTRQGFLYRNMPVALYASWVSEREMSEDAVQRAPIRAFTRAYRVRNNENTQLHAPDGAQILAAVRARNAGAYYDASAGGVTQFSRTPGVALEGGGSTSIPTPTEAPPAPSSQAGGGGSFSDLLHRISGGTPTSRPESPAPTEFSSRAPAPAPASPDAALEQSPQDRSSSSSFEIRWPVIGAGLALLGTILVFGRSALSDDRPKRSNPGSLYPEDAASVGVRDGGMWRAANATRMPSLRDVRDGWQTYAQRYLRAEDGSPGEESIQRLWESYRAGWEHGAGVDQAA